MSEDKDIEIIKARKLREMKERAAAMERAKKAEPEKKEKSPRETVMAYLYDRGDEVLNAAYAQYPAQTEAIVAKIAELIKSGELKERISGGELLSLFRSVGLRVRIDTSIRIQQDGKLVSFSEKLKQHE
ncbi:DNA-binding protein [Nitrososphaera sp.]|uniref:DNA-binding protein n=1 Tax=Nitrososphaera sp. TaxID=1971748 RepID=UPI0018163F33|nr:DNA-binding protein [Nitrososphaera sp.]NWG37457.1 double-stranded DNA-binding protein [Nitrososphaera sp.]